MKKTVYMITVVVGIMTIASCQKAPKDKPVYDNSGSYVSWTVSPIPTFLGDEKITPPPFMSGWCFSQQYKAQRMPETANIGPFYGYPIGTFTPGGKLSFNYSNGNTSGQTMSLFLNSALKINGIGTYAAAACMDNGNVGRIGMNGVSKNLYLSGSGQNFIIDSYDNGYSMDAKINVMVVKGSFQLTVSDCSNGLNQYSISGSFQLAIPANI